MDRSGPSPRRAVVASRQKSCNVCVQTKSRCDRRTPVCSRCAEKSLRCTWGKRTAVAAHQTGASRSNMELLVASGSPLLDLDFTRNTGGGGVTPQSLLLDGFIGHDDMSLTGFVDFTGIGSRLMPSPSQWRTQADEDVAPNEFMFPSPPEEVEYDPQDYRQMVSFCDYLEPWHLQDSNSTVSRAISRVKGFIAEMATSNATPFLHGLLYQRVTPDCIVSCFSTCVIYSNRTPANAAQVMRVLHSSVTGLLNEEANRLMPTPLEMLARTQALLLYQIIRLFDGDIALRARAEKDMPVLRTWLVALCNIRDNLDNLVQLGDDMCDHPPKTWKTWVFDESLRRTVLMAYSVVFLFELIKDPGYRGNKELWNPSKVHFSANAIPAEKSGPWDRPNRWSVARSLWEAESEFEFFQSWKEKPHFIINNYSLLHFSEHGKSEDVDEFAEIILGVYLGMDTTKQFKYIQTLQK